MGDRHLGRGGTAVASGAQSMDPSVVIGSHVAVSAAAVIARERGAVNGVVRARQDAVKKLLGAIVGGSGKDGAEEKTGAVPLWGPDEVRCGDYM